MTILIENIKQLVQVREIGIKKVAGKEMQSLPVLKNAYLVIEDDIIIDFGLMSDYKGVKPKTIINANERIVLPTWCDSHTHLIFAEDRSQEFVDRIKGLSYEEISKKGGGILNSAKKLQDKTEDSLYQDAAIRLQNAIKTGTGAIEIKSGYGLTTEAEVKMLHVIKKLKQNFSIPIKSTFLGAHAIPPKFKTLPDAYVKIIINDMLPRVAQEKLADYIDVFCEKNYFSLEQTDRILSAGKQYNLTPKIHVNQFNAFGGVALGVKHHARSVDHLEILDPEDITALQKSDTMPVALPACSFFINIPYTPARQIIQANLPLALATDYNPGTAPSSNMNFVVSLACIKMNITPEEAINAATINGAYAMGINDAYGSITIGKKANIMITKPISSYQYLPYAFGENVIETVIINGVIQ